MVTDSLHAAGLGRAWATSHLGALRPRVRIFGGRAPDGSLHNDMYVFDLDEEQWSIPQVKHAECC